MRRIPEDRSVVFMNATLVAKIQKNKLEEIWISVLRNNKIDIRTYVYFSNETAPKPTKKGIWLSFKQIPAIIAAFEKYQNDPAKPVAIEFEHSQTEKIRVYVNEYRGSNIFHIRTFYLKDNEFQPGKGISFSVQLLPQMIEAFKQLEKYNGI